LASDSRDVLEVGGEKNQLPVMAENMLFTRETGPPPDIIALERQTRLQTPMAPAKAAVMYVPNLYSSLSALAESWAVALVWCLVIAVFSMMNLLVRLVDGWKKRTFLYVVMVWNLSDYPLIAWKRLETSSIGPPLLIAPAIMLATAQQPITPAVMPTAVMPILEISALASVVAVMVVLLLSMPVVFFMRGSKVDYWEKSYESIAYFGFVSFRLLKFSCWWCLGAAQQCGFVATA
jgi:hypothetical protein